MKRCYKGILFTLLFGVVLLCSILIMCDFLVKRNSVGKLYSEVNAVPQTEVGLLLGTSPLTRLGRNVNPFFNNRIDAVELLYKTGKIKTILISGDENSLDGVNEVECMRDSLVARGIPDNAIVLDGKGYRTITAVERATKVYGATSYVVISQKFHNERAIYLAEKMDLGVDHLSGFNAKNPSLKVALLTYVREYLARVKMFIDLRSYKKR